MSAGSEDLYFSLLQHIFSWAGAWLWPFLGGLFCGYFLKLSFVAISWCSVLWPFILPSNHHQHQDLEIFNQAYLELEFPPLDTSSEEPIFQFTPIFRFLDHFCFLSQLWWTLIWYNLIGIWRSDLLCSSSVAEQCWSSDISRSDGL